MQAKEYIKKEDEVLEIVIRTMTRRVMQYVRAELDGRAYCNNGLSLRDILNDEMHAEYTRLQGVCERASIVMDALKQFMSRSR